MGQHKGHEDQGIQRSFRPEHAPLFRNPVGARTSPEDRAGTVLDYTYMRQQPNTRRNRSTVSFIFSFSLSTPAYLRTFRTRVQVKLNCFAGERELESRPVKVHAAGIW